MASLVSWNFGHTESPPFTKQRIESTFDTPSLGTASFVFKNREYLDNKGQKTLSTRTSSQSRTRSNSRKSNAAINACCQLLAVCGSGFLERSEMGKMLVNEEHLVRLLKEATLPTISTSIAPLQVPAKRLFDTKLQIKTTAEEDHINLAPQDLRPPLAIPADIVHQPTLSCRKVGAPHVGWVEVVELQRPEAKNAISQQMLNELGDVVDRIYQDHNTGAHQIRALVVSSLLSDAFCAGADLKERKRMNMQDTKSFLSQLRSTFAKLAALPIPSIACVSGLALGGGLELALCCHFRVFSRNATVALPETRLAIIPGAGGTFRLPKVVGECHALDMILTGRRVQATEAFKMGMCSRLIDVDECSSADTHVLREATLEAGISLAKVIAAGGPVAIRAALRAVLSTSEEAENAAYDVVLTTDDRLRALDSFAKKCSPSFVGA